MLDLQNILIWRHDSNYLSGNSLTQCPATCSQHDIFFIIFGISQNWSEIVLESRDKPHTYVSIESLRILMSGIAISWRFALKSDVFQIFIKSMISNENINRKLFAMSIYWFWNDFWSILRNIKNYEKYVIFEACCRTKMDSSSPQIFRFRSWN